MAVEEVLVENIEFLIKLLRALGGIFVLYFAYLIANFILNFKRYKQLKEITTDLELIKKKLRVGGSIREKRLPRIYRIYFLVSGFLYGIWALIYFFSLVFERNIIIANIVVPDFLSWIIFLLFGILSFLSFRMKNI